MISFWFSKRAWPLFVTDMSLEASRPANIPEPGVKFQYRATSPAKLYNCIFPRCTPGEDMVKKD